MGGPKANSVRTSTTGKLMILVVIALFYLLWLLSKDLPF
jgi:hypothetical protein